MEPTQSAYSYRMHWHMPAEGWKDGGGLLKDLKLGEAGPQGAFAPAPDGPQIGGDGPWGLDWMLPPDWDIERVLRWKPGSGDAEGPVMLQDLAWEDPKHPVSAPGDILPVPSISITAP
jgi:hypothetical protein